MITETPLEKEVAPKIFLVFDTETGGFPSKKKELTDDTQPPTTQLGVSLCTKDIVIAELSMLLSVGDRYINPRATEANGHTSELCNEFGLNPLAAITAFHAMVIKADMVVGHNISFDTQMIDIEYARAGMTEEAKVYNAKPTYCTMKTTTELCGLSRKDGRPKYPTLEELYSFLFDVKLEGAHDAMVDVQATTACFFDPRVFPFAEMCKVCGAHPAHVDGECVDCCH